MGRNCLELLRSWAAQQGAEQEAPLVYKKHLTLYCGTALPPSMQQRPDKSTGVTRESVYRSRRLSPLFTVPEGYCVDTCCLRALLKEERWTAGGSLALHLRGPRHNYPSLAVNTSVGPSESWLYPSRILGSPSPQRFGTAKRAAAGLNPGRT